MTKTCKTVAAFVVAFLAGPLAASDAPKENDKHGDAAESFKFEGVGFETTLKEFMDKHPDATKDEKTSNEKLGVVVVDNKKVENARLAEYVFVDEKLLSVKVFYTAEDFKKSGGLEIFFDTLRDRFGKWDADSPGVKEGKFQAFWSFPKKQRYIDFVMNDDRAIFQVVNTKLAAVLLEKKKKSADFGF